MAANLVVIASLVGLVARRPIAHQFVAPMHKVAFAWEPGKRSQLSQVIATTAPLPALAPVPIPAPLNPPA